MGNVTNREGNMWRILLDVYLRNRTNPVGIGRTTARSMKPFIPAARDWGIGDRVSTIIQNGNGHLWFPTIAIVGGCAS